MILALAIFIFYILFLLCLVFPQSMFAVFSIPKEFFFQSGYFVLFWKLTNFNLLCCKYCQLYLISTNHAY